MGHNAADYTFWGLMNNGVEANTPITTIAYLVGLVDTPQNEITNLEKAKFVLRVLFDVEEQVRSAPELIKLQEERFPKGYCPQTPVMLSLRWSPIAAIMERGWEPFILTRETRGMNCASGIWEMKKVETAKPRAACETPEDLFWHVLEKVSSKAKSKGLLLSLIAKPGWSYESNAGRPNNLTQAEAEEADRVIWQRTPRRIAA